MKTMIKKTVLAAALLMPLAASAENIIGLKENGDLIAFDSATPGTILKTLTPTGLAGDQLVSIDFRPSTGALYLIATKSGLSTNCQLYTISPTGAVTAVGAVYVCNTIKDIDFDPVGGELRVISDNENYRVDPVSGLKTPDAPPAFAGTDTNATTTASVTGSAYSNNVSGAATSILYVIDQTNDVLAQVLNPSTGVLTTVGPLTTGVSFSTAFDISGAGAGTAYLFNYNFGLNIGQLYTVNLTSGAATLTGQVGAPGTNINLLGMSVAPVSLLGGVSTATASSSGGGAAGVFMLLGLAGLGWWRRRAAR